MCGAAKAATRLQICCLHRRDTKRRPVAFVSGSRQAARRAPPQTPRRRERNSSEDWGNSDKMSRRLPTPLQGRQPGQKLRNSPSSETSVCSKDYDPARPTGALRSGDGKLRGPCNRLHDHHARPSGMSVSFRRPPLLCSPRVCQTVKAQV